MLNEEKIRLMTQMAAFEQKKGKKYIQMSKYYRKDYVGYQMVKTFIYSTLAFGILFLLWVLYKLDYLMENIHKLDVVHLGVRVLLYYIALILVYQVISCIVYNIRYAKGKEEIKRYQGGLKTIMRLYRKEDSTHSMDQ